MLHRRNDHAEDEALRHARLVLTFWFGSRPDLYAYHDVVRVERGGYATYFGKRSWTKVRGILGMVGTSKQEAWTRDRDRAERISRRGGQKNGTRYVAMPADALYDLLERSA